MSAWTKKYKNTQYPNPNKQAATYKAKREP